MKSLTFYREKLTGAFNRKDGSELPMEEARYVVLDTELTGLDEKKDSIISMGAVKMVGGKIQVADSFYRLVNPGTKFSAKSVVIHEITPSDVSEKPDIKAGIKEFLDFCGDDILVGHCVSIDLSFINKEAKRFFGKPLHNPALDTSAIYERLRRRFSAGETFTFSFRDSGLYEIAKHFGIDVTGAHNALKDAFITAQVFQRFLPMLAGGGVVSIGDLLRIGNPLKGGGGIGTSGEVCNL